VVAGAAVVTRPAVDVVVPYAGDDAGLEAAQATFGRLALGAGDTLTVVDNGPPGRPARPGVLAARSVRSSYHARNAGAGTGRNEWLVFLDADVEPEAGLLDAYFATAVGDRVAVLAGGVIDGAADGAVARFAQRTAAMSQDNTMAGRWAYAQTANAAVRRVAFAGVGGFTDTIRSGGDADLCFRLRAAGWEIERREEARVVHRPRTSLAALLRQRARHGSGARWLDTRYPGSFPPRRSLGDLRWALRQGRVGALAHLAFEAGRFVSNDVRR
jgi:GT2 family glycosyltransferase